MRLITENDIGKTLTRKTIQPGEECKLLSVSSHSTVSDIGCKTKTYFFFKGFSVPQECIRLMFEI